MKATRDEELRSIQPDGKDWEWSGSGPLESHEFWSIEISSRLQGWIAPLTMADKVRRTRIEHAKHGDPARKR